MEERENYKKIGMKLSLIGLNIEAFKINLKDQFIWYSETLSPVYSNHNVFLYNQEARRLIVNGFLQILANLSFCSVDAIASSSASAVPYGYRIAELLDIPFFLLMDNNDDPHVKNKRENFIGNNMVNKNIVLVENLISTGENNVLTIDLIRRFGGNCDHCLSIFDYNFPSSEKIFAGKDDFAKGQRLDTPCVTNSLISLADILEASLSLNIINFEEKVKIESWAKNFTVWKY